VRVAIFVAVVAAHLALLWLFTSLHRWVLLPAEDEAAITLILLPPLPPEPTAAPISESEDPPPWSAPLLYPSVSARSDRTLESGQQKTQHGSPRQSTPDSRRTQAPETTQAPQMTQAPQANSALQSDSERQGDSAPGPREPSSSALTSSAPDWRAAAEVTAQTSAQHIVEAEDDAARKAAALTSRFKPLPGPRVQGPEFAWDYAHTHRITPLQGGGFVIALNDRCSIAILPLPMLGCSVGRKSPANGDLFKIMHPPVKFGDWDWRLDDP
jgi:hypothetical protein